jgi:AraC-like DNA-binding protein
MASSTVRTFTDPDAYHATMRARRVDGVVTERGEFHAELTRIDFDRLLMQRADENLPRVLNMTTNPRRVAVIFAIDHVPSDIRVSGLPLSAGEIIAWDSGTAGHHKSAAPCKWGTMSLSHEDLSADGEAIVGRRLPPPSNPHRIKPPAPLVTRLLNLHETAAHLAKTTPDILAKPEVGQALEQALVEAMISCLASSDSLTLSTVPCHHAKVMRRLEQVLDANSEEPLYMAELCTAVGVSYPTLRASCHEHLGMSPKRYLWLRRMHLAQRALRTTNPENATVTEIATNYGFWELGRFSVTYRSLFGESPSATLRRPPDAPGPREITEPPSEFTKSA